MWLRCLIVGLICVIPFTGFAQGTKGKSSTVEKKEAKDEAVIRKKGKLKDDASLKEVIKEYQTVLKENPRDADAWPSL